MDKKFDPLKGWAGQFGFGSKELTPHEKMKRKAIDNDRRIQDLATYELTKGLCIPCPSNDEILCKFAEYKRRIQLGSFTVNQLEEMILTKYAITDKPKEKFLEGIEVLDYEPEPYELDGDEE